MLKAIINISDIQKLQIYVANCQKTISQIKSLTGADYIINAGLYNMSTTKPVKYLKVDGVVLSGNATNEYGFAWNVPTGIVMTNGANYNNYNNGINCIELIRNNAKANVVNIDPALGGKRGRSAIGLTNDNKLVLVCSGDGSSTAMTPSSLQTYMANCKCKDALMLDGGGSASCNFKGQTITTSRKVNNYILVYLKKTTSTATTSSYAVPTITLRKGSRGNGVKWLQTILNKKGFNCGAVDGIFGNGTFNAVIKYQKYNNLVADGIVGKNTRSKLLE